MIYSMITNNILEKAEEIRNEFGCEMLYASHILTAAAELCSTVYTGLAAPVGRYPACRFEEERLRYVFSSVLKLSNVSMYRKFMSANKRDGVKEEEFKLSLCEDVMAARNTQLLSADILFLCALKELEKPYSAALRSALTSDADVLEILQNTDENIYDYVIGAVEKIIATLREKAEDAAALRDWRPAPKFAEEGELPGLFFSGIKRSSDGKAALIVLKGFFGRADLKLTIYNYGGVFYVHDNGCAVKQLAGRIKDKERLERVLSRVCHPCRLDKKRVTGRFVTTSSFLYYLQRLVFIAHADLCYTRLKRHAYCKDKDYVFVPAGKAEPLNEALLYDTLGKTVRFGYDENSGLWYSVDASFAYSSVRPVFLMEAPENGKIRLSDMRKGKYEGEIFEAFYWNNKDIEPYSKFIAGFAERFGGEFDGKNIYLTDKSDNFVNAVYRFFNLSVLLSELGSNITLPALRKKA